MLRDVRPGQDALQFPTCIQRARMWGKNWHEIDWIFHQRSACIRIGHFPNSPGECKWTIDKDEQACRIQGAWKKEKSCPLDHQVRLGGSRVAFENPTF